MRFETETKNVSRNAAANSNSVSESEPSSISIDILCLPLTELLAEMNASKMSKDHRLRSPNAENGAKKKSDANRL